MGRFLTAWAVVAMMGSAFASVALADEAASASDDLRATIREEIKAYQKEQKSDFRVYWKNGLNMKTHDGNFALKIGGRIQADFVWFDDYDSNLETATGGEWHSGFEFRRARLYVSGEIYKYVAFKAQYDFAGGDVDFKDVWVGLHGMQDCLGCMFPDITVGHFKEYFCLEELTSSKYVTFMERSFPTSTFAPSRNMGLGLFRSFYGDRATVGVGVFGDADDYGEGTWTDGGYHLTGRATFMPWAPCNCESRFWEIGASYSYQGELRELRYRTRTNAGHVGPRIVDTGAFDADSAQLVGVETAFGYDRWHFQAEYLTSIVKSAVADDPTYWGWYAEASYMLLGGTRPFKRAHATFDRVKPCQNFLGKDCCGFGGLELAGRYEYINLDDGNFEGGVASAITVGLNWYLNPNTVVKLNYVYADVDNAHGAGSPAGDGTVNALGMRFQVDF